MKRLRYLLLLPLLAMGALAAPVWRPYRQRAPTRVTSLEELDDPAIAEGFNDQVAPA